MRCDATVERWIVGMPEVQQTTAKGAGKPVSSNHTTSAQTRGPVTLAIPVQTPKSEK